MRQAGDAKLDCWLDFEDLHPCDFLSNAENRIPFFGKKTPEKYKNNALIFFFFFELYFSSYDFSSLSDF